MTTQQTPQIPESVQAGMGEWGRRHAYRRQIDEESGRLDRQITEMQRQLTELGQRYSDLGRMQREAEREEGIARAMVEAGFQLAGLPMPEQPPAVQPPAPAAEMRPAEQQPGGFAAPSGVETPGAYAPPVAGPTAETVTDAPPEGGDQTGGEPGFQPESGDPEPRRRRGARRGQ